MKRFFIIITLSLTLCGNITADVETPDIFAICKVTLKNDKTIQGIVFLARGGYGSYRQNGFCEIFDNGTKQLILYNLYFVSYSPGSDPRKLYYVENLISKISFETSNSLDNTNGIITRKTIETQEYKLRDEMVLYKTLPLLLILDPGFSDTISIKVSEIKEVELLTTPDSKWLNIIADAKEKSNSKILADIEENDSAWPDYVEPVWYHEVLTDCEMMKYLLTHF